MILRLNPSSGVPVYVQLMEQIKHAVETGALQPGDQLPTIRSLAEELVTNPNTVARAYRELERDRVVELRQGSGAFVSARYKPTSSPEEVQRALASVKRIIGSLIANGLSPSEIRRLFENELSLQERRQEEEEPAAIREK
jgi:GntR family transcriptional regulator